LLPWRTQESSNLLRLKLPTEHSRHSLELTLTVFLWQASTGVFLLALAQQYLTDQLNGNAAFPGYALALYAGARFVLQTPAGWLADRIGRRQTLALGIGLALPSVVLMMQVRDPNLFLAFSAIYGAGSAAVWPAMMAQIGDTHERSSRAGALNMLNLAQLMGLGLGTMAGVMLIDMLNYQATFAACLAFSSLALVLAYQGARRENAAPPAPVAPKPRIPLRERLMTPGLLMLAGIVLLLSIGTTVQAPAIGAYTSEVLNTKMHVLGLMLLAPGLVAGVVALRCGKLADRFGRQPPMIIGLALAALSYYALSQTSSPLIAVHLVVLAGLAYAVSIPAWGAAVLDATELGSRGLVLGALATVQAFGGAAGQAIGGVVNGAWGPLAPFKIGAILLMLALVLTIVHLQHQRRSTAAAPVAVRID
jgi:MFS family permease